MLRNDKIVQGTNPFVEGDTAYYVDEDGVKSFKVHTMEYASESSINISLWDADMTIMIRAYEGFQTEEEATAAYAEMLKEAFERAQRYLADSQVLSIFTLRVSDTLLSALADTCPHFPSTENGEDGIVVLTQILEDAEPTDYYLKEILRSAQQERCTYIHLKPLD